MNRPSPDRPWRRALSAGVTWCGLAASLTAAAAAGVHYLTAGDETPLSVAAVLIWSALTGTFVFPAVAVVAGLSRRSVHLFLLVAGLWFGAWAVIGVMAVGYFVFFGKRITP